MTAFPEQIDKNSRLVDNFVFVSIEKERPEDIGIIFIITILDNIYFTRQNGT